MALEDLERDGMLKPRDQWGTTELHTRVARIPLVVVALLAIGGCVVMYVGDGDLLTWIGLVAFLVALGAFTWLSWRGIR
jgi:hypothetical protein